MSENHWFLSAFTSFTVPGFSGIHMCLVIMSFFFMKRWNFVLFLMTEQVRPSQVWRTFKAWKGFFHFFPQFSIGLRSELCVACETERLQQSLTGAPVVIFSLICAAVEGNLTQDQLAWLGNNQLNRPCVPSLLLCLWLWVTHYSINGRGFFNPLLF